MADLLFIGITLTFFLLAGLLVRACDHIIGPEESVVPDADHTVEEGVAA